MSWNDPDEQVAGKMTLATAMAQRHNLKKEYRRVNLKEYPEGYFTISAFDPLPELRVINTSAKRLAA